MSMKAIFSMFFVGIKIVIDASRMSRVKIIHKVSTADYHSILKSIQPWSISANYKTLKINK